MGACERQRREVWGGGGSGEPPSDKKMKIKVKNRPTHFLASGTKIQCLIVSRKEFLQFLLKGGKCASAVYVNRLFMFIKNIGLIIRYRLLVFMREVT